MPNARPASPLLWLLLLVLLFSGGCAAHLAEITPLAPEGEKEARALLDTLRARSCPDFLDADLHVRWSGYGTSRTLPVSLQITAQGHLRATLPDPLGRPLMILAGNEERLLLVDNRESRAYRGTLDDAFFASRIPAGLRTETLFGLLAGRLPADGVPLLQVGGGEGSLLHYLFALPGERHLLVAVDPATTRLTGQMLGTEQGDLLLDVRYVGEAKPGESCTPPRRIEVSGSAIDGTLAITLEALYPEPLPESLFQLSIPPHYRSIPVD